jgi:cob(I)alamin adenosyltransferase
MVALNKIYTRTGDDGSTGLVGGARVKKASRKVWAYGDVDELNAHLGLCLAFVNDATKGLIGEKLITIQNELFDIGAELATPTDAHWEGMLKATQQHVEKLEHWIDELNEPLPTLKSFILPGGSALAAQLHIARTVCRRAERSILLAHEQEPVSSSIREYMNRLSDLLFVMARAVLLADNQPEYLWAPGASRPIAAAKKPS